MSVRHCYINTLFPVSILCMLDTMASMDISFLSKFHLNAETHHLKEAFT